MTTPAHGIGLYIHIPFCQRKCPYCAFYSVPVEGRSPQRLIAALLGELDLYDITEPVDTIYIGGGSPTCLPGDLLTGFVAELTRRFGPVTEFTVESNPAQLTPHLAASLYAAGVNRLSVGAQSFDADELKMLGRLHGPEQITEAVRAAQSADFGNIGLDLIFGLPGSDLMAWQTTLDRTLELGVQHISAYSLTIEHRTPFERAVQQRHMTMIDEALERTMYELARGELPLHGFTHYEISNFARPGYVCRHNLRYWRNWPVVGIGPAAAGWFRGRRTLNVPDIDGYCNAIEAGRPAHRDVDTPGPEQIASETAILNLRMLDGIDRDEFAEQTGLAVETLFAEAVNKNTALDFLEQTDTHLRLTDVGLSFADAVAEDFIL